MMDFSDDDRSFKFFVGGLTHDAWEDDLRKHFSLYGTVKEVQVMKDRATQRNRGFGFVTMADDSMKESIFRNIHMIKNKKVDLREMQADAGNNLKRRIFVGGVNAQLSEDDLAEYFKQYGPIEKVTIMRDGDGRSRRFGFIVFGSEDSLPSVLKKSIHYLDENNKVEVRAAESRKSGSASTQDQRSGMLGGAALGDFGMYPGYMNYDKAYGAYGAFGMPQPLAPYPIPFAQPYPYPYAAPAATASARQPSPGTSTNGSGNNSAAGASYWGADGAAAMAAYAAAYGPQAAAYFAQQPMHFGAYGPQRVSDTSSQQPTARSRGPHRSGPY